MTEYDKQDAREFIEFKKKEMLARRLREEERKREEEEEAKANFSEEVEP